ncbi:inner membrane protein YqjE [Klebsiella pneumoniae]|uniref:Inner membrane protein YqjE n=1 Tax=Klebsiella pneumoniae TaxID=573 RepID=A0A378A7F7_KLEPN|nr:inner membrane protein YqjE [Klebsiella pneumoniae]
MANTQHTQGPGQRVFSIGQRIVTLLVEMVENAAASGRRGAGGGESHLFQLLIMTGLTLLFAAFGLMSLLVLVIWAVDAQYRLHVMIATTVVLLLAAAIVGILTLRKARRSTLLRLTRKELENDRALLEEDKS